MTEKLSAWTAVLSSIITVGLTVYNATLNTKIQQAKVDLTRVQTEINQKYAELEVRKERTSRYEFVNKLLPDVLKKDRSQVTLTTNLISLALTEEEARKLFDGFQISQDINVQEVGKIGHESLNKQITQQRDRLSSALAQWLVRRNTMLPVWHIHSCLRQEKLFIPVYKTGYSRFDFHNIFHPLSNLPI